MCPYIRDLDLSSFAKRVLLYPIVDSENAVRVGKKAMVSDFQAPFVLNISVAG